jgi:predicted signal transduction protein with EAL and GGDEF domain
LSETGPAPFLEALRDGASGGDSLAVLIIDCGVIGRIDALWGYHVGDAVRDRVAALLRAEVLRPGDLLGTMGRDDVACVFSGVDDPAVAMLAAEKSLRALNAPFWIGEEELFASPAIGIALCPAHGGEAELLLQRARSACTHARGLTSRIAHYEGNREDPAASSFLLENRLRTAVSEDALEMVFQPQYDLRLGQIMGAESLLRWPDAARGPVAAEQAFAAAESVGAVNELVSSMLNRALRNISEFRYSAGLDLRISVPLAARALLNTDLPDVVQRALGTWSLRPGRLNLEICETAVLRAEPLARETLARLKALGLKLSIDDASMALSSLSWFAALPFQEIKIDISAMHDPAGAPKSGRILQSLIELARHLRLQVVAVGVADEAMAARLKELGCDYMQADYRGPALDAKAFVARFGFGDG